MVILTVNVLFKAGFSCFHVALCALNPLSPHSVSICFELKDIQCSKANKCDLHKAMHFVVNVFSKLYASLFCSNDYDLWKKIVFSYTVIIVIVLLCFLFTE